MVMEKGESDLRKILVTYNTSLPLYTLMNYWHQMLEAVGYIHKKDIIHSDLKPESNYTYTHRKCAIVLTE